MAVLSCRYYSKARMGAQVFTAVLPVETPPAGGAAPGYGAGPWPTIYLLHGFSGNQNDWLLRSHVETWAMQAGYAVIMPGGGNTIYLDNEETGEQNGQFIGEELLTVTRSLFPLSHKREDTVIGGLSMGGYGALRNGLYYGDTFGAILAMSSALIAEEAAEMAPGSHTDLAPYGYYHHTFGELSQLLGSDKDPRHVAKTRLAAGNPPRLFLCCGSEDFLLPHNTAFHEYLTGIGYPHTWWAGPGIHDFAFWNQALEESFRWLKEGL